MRVRTVVEEEPVVLTAPLTGSYVTDDRVAIDRVVDTVPMPLEVDGVTIIPSSRSGSASSASRWSSKKFTSGTSVRPSLRLHDHVATRIKRTQF